MKEIAQNLKEALSKGFPGWHPRYNPDTLNKILKSNRTSPQENTASCAVAVLLFKSQENQICTSLIQRPLYERGAHKGQISFPGGRMSREDASLVHTALRETEEEIGVKIPQQNVLGKLSRIYIPPSNTLVTPFITYLEEPPTYTISPREVDEVLEAPLHTWAVNDSIKDGFVTMRDQKYKVPYYDLNGRKVWGATAMIISELLRSPVAGVLTSPPRL